MATEDPDLDVNHRYFAQLIAAYDSEAFPDGPPDDLDARVGAAYNDFFKKPYVCLMMADVMTGRWGLGTRQEVIAERLGGANRSWVSHSLRRGRLTLDLYMRFRCCPTRLADWEPDIDALQAEMGRSAFIGVAQLLAKFVSKRRGLAPSTFDELNYELLCEVVFYWETWLPLRVAGRQTELAEQLIRNVSDDPARKISPAWHTPAKRGEVLARIKRFKDNPVLASDFLTRLEQNWTDVVAKTFDYLTQVKWRQP
jgi:hypothetical protein